MSDMDALVEKAARAMSVAASRAIGDDVTWDSMPEPERNNCRALTRAALEAVGLPALLERVEAAEGEAERLRDSYDTVAVMRERAIRRLDAVYAERDALVAKVADAWDEGNAVGYGATPGQKGRSRGPNPYRAALTEGTEG